MGEEREENVKGVEKNEFESGKEGLKVSFMWKLIRASSVLGEGQGWTSGGTREVLIPPY